MHDFSNYFGSNFNKTSEKLSNNRGDVVEKMWNNFYSQTKNGEIKGTGNFGIIFEKLNRHGK